MPKDILKHVSSPFSVRTCLKDAVCVDVGHAAISGPDPEELIRGLDNKTLGCLHIHDNDYLHDQH
ncbi:MAG: hypothetical protein IJ940_03355, partial [Bacteroidales bacterium]|nr:hypothetical protein [Bacteroidales bacterium]